MPDKKAENGKRYSIDGKTFTWTTEDGDQVEIPMRIKLKVVRAMPSGDLNADQMFQVLDALVPGQSDKIDEMDLNDFEAMFNAWQTEYRTLTGASLGE